MVMRTAKECIKNPDAKEHVTWHVAMRPALDKANNPMATLADLLEKIKAGIRAKVEHPFKVLRRQFGY